MELSDKAKQSLLFKLRMTFCLAAVAVICFLAILPVILTFAYSDIRYLALYIPFGLYEAIKEGRKMRGHEKT